MYSTKVIVKIQIHRKGLEMDLGWKIHIGEFVKLEQHKVYRLTQVTMTLSFDIRRSPVKIPLHFR